MMKVFSILKRNQFQGKIKAKNNTEALESYLLQIGFKPRDFKDLEFMACWEAVED